MVKITKKQNLLLIDIIGFHKIWALKHQLRVTKQDVISAYQNESELEKSKGFRFGTYIPNFITAGTFRKLDGTTNFWDVMNKKNTIIIELRNNFYHKLYLEVENPTETITLLTS